MNRPLRTFVWPLVYLMSSAVPVAAGGLDGPGGETAWNAAEENYQAAEGGRRAQIARQLDLNYRLRWLSGYVGNPYCPVFEPWPMVPGDIWGYPGAAPLIESPSGFESIQTGPDRWEYRPVYPMQPAPEALPVPEQVRPTPEPGRGVQPRVLPERPGPRDPDAFRQPAAAGPRKFGRRQF